MNSTMKVWVGLAIGGAIALGWTCRFQITSQQEGVFYMVNRWTGQVYVVTTTFVSPVPELVRP
jgi:hypothetical protein